MPANLFEELDSCTTCPKHEFVTDENKQEIESHLISAHSGINATSFVVAKQRDGYRGALQAVYDKAYPYLDGDFHTRFLREFDQLSWELTIFNHLTISKIKINSNKHTGPDFDTELGYIECICVGQGIGDNAIPLPKVALINAKGKLTGAFEMQAVPVDAMKLRIGSGFYDKQQKYKGYVNKGIIDPQKPRIIAINWYCEGAAWMTGRGEIAHDPAIQTIFGSGNRQITVDTKTGRVLDSGVAHVPSLIKSNGKEVDMGFFIGEVESNDLRIDGVIINNGWPGLLSLEHTKAINNPMSDVDFKLELLGSSLGYRAKINQQTGKIDLSKI